MKNLITKQDLQENRNYIINVIVSRTNKSTLPFVMELILNNVEAGRVEFKRSKKVAIDDLLERAIKYTFDFDFYVFEKSMNEIEEQMEKSKRENLPSS